MCLLLQWWQMTHTTLKVLILERLAEARRRVHETAVKVRENVTCALNGRSCEADEAGHSQQQFTVRLLDDYESEEQSAVR